MNRLNPNKALIFRITHIANVSWILDNGVHCGNSECFDPNYVQIGSADLIGKRLRRRVPVAPGGTLGDYVPFYFTPFSPMLLNIRTGHGDVKQWPMENIVILVSSLYNVAECGIRFVFTDRHAYLETARYFNDLKYLDRVDWDILQRRDFKRDPDEPGKIERYQAEALIHQLLPVKLLLGIVCNGEKQKVELEHEVARRNLSLKVINRPGWYFS